MSSSLYDAAASFSTGLGDEHTHDAQLAVFVTGYNRDIWQRCLRVDRDEYFVDADASLVPDAESIFPFANPVQPHSEGGIRLASADPLLHPDIRMNYYGDSHDLDVMIAVLRRALDIAEHWPDELGPLVVPKTLAAKHDHKPRDRPSDPLLADMARHYSFTVYHLTSTCRIGSVVDPQLRMKGARRLRVADASVMPNVVSGNTNAVCIMIGEKAAELLAAEHGVQLAERVSAGVYPDVTKQPGAQHPDQMCSGSTQDEAKGIEMDVVATFERVLDRTNEVVDRVDPDQLGNPTPCTEWDVRAVINHITGGATMFAECVEQGSVPDARLGELMGGDNLGDDFKGRYRAASDRARATFAMPGALDKTVKLPFGEMPAGVALNIAIMDVMTHAADIATATGQNIDDEEILTVALDVGHQLITDDFRKPGIFDAEQPADANASAADKLLAFAGRKV